nr:PREDICTED: uncharacterized protein LOC105663969 [Megachile rotundata]
MHINGLNEVWKKFDDLQFSIEELDESEGARRFEIQNNYYAVVARANRLLQNTQTPVSPTTRINPSPASTVPAPMAIKLPEMRLPTFDGSIEEWSSFYDIFSAMIGRNEDLTPVQKLQYLRSTLIGKAAACIQSLSTTDANYNDAIEILKEKFDCPRRIILDHCDALRNIPKLSKDTPEALNNLIDIITQHLRALKNLGENVTSWNSILLSIILSKLNNDTIWHWELTLKDKRKIPEYTELLQFLERRASCALPSYSKSTVSTGRNETKDHDVTKLNNKRSSRGYAFLVSKSNRNHPYKNVSTNKPQTAGSIQRCPICKQCHVIWMCEQFNSLSVQDRKMAVEKESLCFNCLREGHTVNSCKKGNCRICHKRHNTLLYLSTNSTNSPSQRSADSHHTTNHQKPTN